MKKKFKFKVDKSDIKVPFDELLFDIIFVIVITKISQMLFAAQSVTVVSIISALIMFISLVWVWLFRVNQLNKIHILQHKLNDFTLKSETLTYLEITILVMVLFTIQSFHMKTILLLLFVAIIITQFSFGRIRSQVISNPAVHKQFHEMYNYQRPERNERIINVNYVYERFGIIFVLFMGEILSATFTTSHNPSSYFLIVVLIVAMFSNNIRILEVSKESLLEDANYNLYRGTLNYAKSILSLLLCVLVTIEANHQFSIAPYVTLALFVIYYLSEWKMLSVIDLKPNFISYLFNMFVLLIIIMEVNVNPLLKIGFGVIIFVVNIVNPRKLSNDKLEI